MSPTKEMPPKLPNTFREITLELAREPQRPRGDSQARYTIIAPLDHESRIDASTWEEYRDRCRVVRLRPGEDNQVGHLIRRPGGGWAFRYDVSGSEDEEAGYHFDQERFVLGEYVSIREDDGMHTYRVTSVAHI